MKRCFSLMLVVFTVSLAVFGITAAPVTLRQSLRESNLKIAYESYVDQNWEIFVMNADGTRPVNLTRTPKVHEHYPQVSPDGKRICFVADEGEDRETVRSLWIMDSDGGNRRRLVDHAREPFWSPDSRTLGYLPQEYRKFNVIDYYTKGMNFYDLATGKITPHPNHDRLHHLYNPSYAPNGKWIAATVHAGMGFGHAILLIEANGPAIIDLGIPGCRPCLSPDGRQIAWGAGDNELVAAPINLDADQPKVGERRLVLQDKHNQIYHVDWSPDSRFLSFSRGPEGKGNPSLPGTFQADYAPIVGVYAPGWNVGVVSADRPGILDLEAAGDRDLLMLTTNGLSNKEPAWFRPPR